MKKLLLKYLISALFTIMLLGGSNVFAQIPVITYTTPQTITTGTNISLSPTVTGGAVGALTSYSAVTALTATNINAPDGLTVDASSNIYVCNYGNGRVYKYTAGTGTAASFITGLTNPTGIVFDSSGNIYVLDASTKNIYKYTSAGGASPTATYTTTGLTTVHGFAIDASDNLYITSYNGATNYQVVKYNPNTSTQTTLISGGSLNQPIGVAVDVSGNVFVTNLIGGAVLKYDSSGTLISSTFATGFTAPYAIAIDKGGFIYVADYAAAGTIKVFSPLGGTALSSISSVANCKGITIDNKGLVYYPNNTANTVSKFTPKGGYFVDKKFTAGLSFDGITGIISGTPTATSASVTYTVIAYNTSGASAVKTVAITVVDPPAISYSPNTQIYPLNRAISSYSPAQSGGTVATYSGYSTGTALTGATLNGPYGMAVDTAGNIYVANSTAGNVIKYDASGTYAGVFVSSLTNPVGVVFDSSNNCYILCEATTSTVKKYSAAGALINGNYIAGLNQSYGIALDASNNFYITNITGTTYTIKKFNAAGTTVAVTAFATLNTPKAITVDAAGKVYIFNSSTGGIYQYASTGGTATSWITTLSGVTALTTDALGNLYVANAGASNLKVYNSAKTLINTITIAATTNMGIVVDRYGNLYAANGTGNTVNKYRRDGGYFISKTLPTGLAFNSATGAITGTPTVASAMTTYTITAYNTSNPGGSGYTLINISTQLLAPDLSYTTPVSEKVAIAIATGSNTIAVTNLGSPITAAVTYNTPTTLPNGASAISSPYAIAFDASGNIYIANSGGNNILKYTSAGVYSGVFVTTVTNPTGIVFDSAGNCFVLSEGASSIVYKYNSSGGAQSTFIGSGLAISWAMAIDASDNLYITNNASGVYSIKKYNSAGVAQSLLALTPLTAPQGITVSKSGIIYVLNAGATGRVYSYPAAGGAGTSLITGLNTTTLYGLTSDGAGNLYISDSGNNLIKVYNAAGTGLITNIALTGARGVGVNADGTLYASGFTNSTISKYTPLTGYFVDELPVGLTLNSATGEIWGTPTVSTPATDCTVTGWNAAGTGNTIINITCYQQYSWLSTSSTVWNNTTNWGGTIPGPADQVVFGSTATALVAPVLPSGITTIGSILFQNGGTTSPGIVVNSGSTLTATGDISFTTTGANVQTATISGTGIVNAANLYVKNVTNATSFLVQLSSSVTNLNLSGNLVVSGVRFSGTKIDDARFNLTGGTMTVDGIQTINPNAANTSTIAITAGTTLNLTGADAFSGLSSTGTNTITGLNSITVGYTGNNNQVVYTDLAIPNSSLTSGISYTNLTIGGTTGIKTPAGDNTNSLNISGNFTNLLTSNATNTYFDLSQPTVKFNGTTQTLAGGGGTGTTFTNVTFSGAGTKTLSTGGFNVSNDGVLTMSGSNPNTILAAGAGLLTLVSDESGSATVAAIAASGPSITGTVNVQRYVTGNNDLAYRGYRLFSSPIADATSPSYANYNLSYLFGSGTYLTGASGGGFNATGNPTMYFYREDVIPNNSSFTAGNYRAITKIDNSPHLYTIGTIDGDKDLPIGNGMMFFYRGNMGTNTSTAPSSLTLSSSGRLNQGTITVKPWFSTAVAAPYYLSYNNAAVTDPRYPVQGFNLVGNPYPSSIDWNKVLTGTSTSGIYAPNTDQVAYIYNATTKNYDSYSAVIGLGTNGMTNIIPQGQGFFVRALTNTAQLIFNESAKVTGQPNILLLNATAAPTANGHLRLQLAKDNINKDETVVVFNSKGSAAYVQKEDALYLKGSGVLSLSSRSSDNRALCINQLSFLKNTQIIPLNVNVSTSGTYKLNLTEATDIPDIYDIWLMDGYTKDSIDIKHNPTYSFNTTSDTATYGSRRFKLVIRENTALAVRLLSFTATKGTTDVKISWTAENERNYTTYVLQRSTNGGAAFTVLDSLTSASFGTYNDLDPNPVAGKNLYRLKQIDVLGNITYSSAVEIVITTTVTGKPVNTIMVYPNPVRNSLAVVIKPAKNSPANYRITINNNMGITAKTGATNQPLWRADVEDLLPGTYFINVINTTDNNLIGQTTFIKL